MIYLYKIRSGISVVGDRILLSKLSTYRFDKVNRLKSEDAKRNTIFSELLLRFALINHKVSNHFTIRESAIGQLSIDGKDVRIEFNVSHSHDYVALVIDCFKVGIDIEKVCSFDKETVDLFCNEKEKMTIRKANDEREMYFKIWTAKESSLKAIGLGLYGDLKKVVTLFDNENVIKAFIGVEVFKIQQFKLDECLVSVSYKNKYHKLKIVTEKEMQSIIDKLKKSKL